MAVDWAETTLGECATWLSGGTPFKGNQAFWCGSIPWVSAKDMKSFRLHDAEDHISPLAIGNGGKLVPAGTILLLVRGMTLHNDVPICMISRQMAFNQDIKALRPAQNVDGAFLAYWLLANKPDLLASVDHAGHGTGRLVTEALKKMPVHLPSLSEQKAIAAVLGALDDKIELNRRMNATLEAMARALFKSWFVDFDPVRAKLDGHQPVGLDPASAVLFPEHLEDSPLGHIPKGWKVVGLPEAIDFLEGPGLRNWQYRDEGMKFLNIRCIGDGDLNIAKANCISLEEFEKTYRHFALQEDDVVISTSGTLGRLAIVRADHLPVMLNTSIIRMRGRGSVGLGYLWGFLQSEYFLAEMFALAAGSVQLNFGPMHLRQISILRPPDGILEGFERAVQPLLRKCLQLRKESHTLATLRDTLLPKLLSGELSMTKLELGVT